MTFFESRLRLNFKDFQEMKVYFKVCEELGIECLIIEPRDFVSRISIEKKRRIEELTTIPIFFRNNIHTDNLNNFKKQIRKFNGTSDILSVESCNKDVQIHAARDSRVDIISFSDPDINRTLTKGIVSLIKQNKSFIEFSLASLMESNKGMQSKNFRSVYKSLRMVRKQNVKMILSGDCREPYGLRHPRGLMSICHTLLEIPLKDVKTIFSINPIKLIERAKIKGVKDVLEGKIVKNDKGDEIR